MKTYLILMLAPLAAPALFVIVDEIMIINQITHNISIKFATELCNVRV